MKKLINKSGHFDDTMKLDWQPMESFVNWRCQCVSVTVCDNLSKCILDILQFAYVKTRQTSEERITIVKKIASEMPVPHSLGNILIP